MTAPRTIHLPDGRAVQVETHGYRRRLYHAGEYIGSYFPARKTWGWRDATRAIHGKATTLRHACSEALAYHDMRQDADDPATRVERSIEQMCDLGGPWNRHTAIHVLAGMHGIEWNPSQPNAFLDPALNRLENALGLPHNYFQNGPM